MEGDASGYWGGGRLGTGIAMLPIEVKIEPLFADPVVSGDRPKGESSCDACRPLFDYSRS